MLSTKLKTQSGSSLIEVMISALVMGVGLLGIMSLQARSLQYNQNAYLYSQAVFLAQDMAERMMANTEATDSYAIDMDDPSPGSSTTFCISNACTPDQIADWDKTLWRASVAKILPSGKSAISRNMAAKEFVVEISFDGSRGESDPQKYTLVVDIE